MAMSDDTNEFLRTNLVFENDLNPLFKCGLCNNIIVDCCITSCDCFFCRNCILKYFENKDIINCPTCKKENIGSNIKRNKSINNKIKLIRVKCSNSTCEEIDTISNMKNHIKECDKGKLSCPFINLGCNKSDINGNHEMKVHFSRNLVEHNEILINVLGTLDNDIKVMKEQIRDLTKQNEDKSNKINELYMKVDGLTNKNRESENKLNNQEMKINELENKVEQMEVSDVNLRRELEEYKTNSRRCQDKIDEFEIRFDDLMRITDQIKKDGEDAKMELWREISFPNRDFIWKVEKLSEKRRDASYGRNVKICSRVFSTHKYGYKIRLTMYPDEVANTGGSNFCLFFVIMKGSYDEILEWPFNRTIKLSFINQDNWEDEEIESYKIDTIRDEWKDIFDKPIHSQNRAHGFVISWNKLIKYRNLIKNDILFIKCSTSCY